MVGCMARPAVVGGEPRAANVPEAGVRPGADSGLGASVCGALFVSSCSLERRADGWATLYDCDHRLFFNVAVENARQPFSFGLGTLERVQSIEWAP